jgi:hypothetical protein
MCLLPVANTDLGRSRIRGRVVARRSKLGSDYTSVSEGASTRTFLRGEATMRAGQHGFEDDGVHDDANFPDSICFISPLSMRRFTSSAPPTNVPLTNTIGKVGHPVHIFNAKRRCQLLR